MENKIDYSTIMDLGFKAEYPEDKIYFLEHGYNYSIITKYLTKKIYLDWVKDTKICTLIRIDSPKKCNIMAEITIRNIDHLNEIINFFKDEEPDYEYTCA